MNTSLHQRISNKRKELKLTKREVSEFVGVSDVSVGKWERGEAIPKGRYLYALSEKLECSIDWILYGREGVTTQAISKKIPLISLREVVEQSLDIENCSYWKTGADVGPNAYAVKVSNESMTTQQGSISIPVGSIIIVEPDAEAVQGDIVISHIKGSQEAVIKKLVIDGPITYLASLNSGYRPIEMDSSCKILGVAKRLEVDL